jgi:hypothetical protein
MRRIIKRFLTRDPQGRAISSQSEHLSDDENGDLQVTTERTAAFCTGCRRDVMELSELRGVCDWCHQRGCCVHCISKCQICARRLCGTCRRGFAGDTSSMTVCPSCHHRLDQRQHLLNQRQRQQDRQATMQQMLQNQLMIERLKFDREMSRRREWNEIAALRLKAQDMQWTAQLQVARLRLDAGLPPFPQKSLPRILIGKVIGYVARISH